MNSQTPDISIIIVSWNTRDLLADCLASIELEIETGDRSCEVIIVDNHSTDGTAENVAREFPGHQLIALDRNIGFAAANNRGIDVASGRSILLLNPDTVVQPGALDTLWNGLHAAPHVGMVSAALINPDGSLQSAGFHFPWLTQFFLDLFPLHPRLVESKLNGRVSIGDWRSPVAIDHPLGACMMVRRDVIDQVGSLDEGYFIYSEEIDWCQRIREAGWTILTIPLACITHYGGQSTSQQSDRMFQQLHESRALYFQRWSDHTFRTRVGRIARLAAWLQRFGLYRWSQNDMQSIAALYQNAANVESGPRGPSIS